MYFKPLTFDSFVGNSYVKNQLKSIDNSDRVFLITGKDGVGKTAFARLLAKSFSKSDEKTLESAIKWGSFDITEDIIDYTLYAELDNLQNKIVIVDDAELLSNKEIESLIEYIQSNVTCKFIIVLPNRSYMSYDLKRCIDMWFNIDVPSIDEQVTLLKEYCKLKDVEISENLESFVNPINVRDSFNNLNLFIQNNEL